ncbi:MAG: arginine--tRNA ligase, partial [Desulfurococcaceae archaeon]
MNPQNPYNSIVEELSLRIHRSLFLRGLTIDLSELMSEVIEPPSREMGDLGIALHKYAKRLGLKPDQLAEETKDFLNDLPGLLCAKAISGYLNVTYSPEYIAKVTISSVKNVENYGYVPSKKTLKIVVEHTSANPIHPLHIGHGRNALLGDTLYRLLTNRGHLVQRRFYINDTGRQVALLAFGYKLIGRKPPENAKPDEWLGKLYALTNLLIELRSIESTLSKLRNESKSRELSELEEEKYRELLRKADEIAASLGRLWEEDKELFDEVSKALMEHKGDPEEEILKIMSSYERGEEWAKSLVREVVDRALAGIRETLSKLGVEFDKWDYESDLVWSGLVNEVVSKA